MLKRLLEKIIPFTIISTNKIDAALPAYIGGVRIEIITNTKRIVIAKKVNNLHNRQEFYKRLEKANKIIEEL